MGKQLILDVLSHKKTDRAPWLPFAGVHSGKLVGYNATEVLTDGDRLLESLLAVNRLYKPDGQPIIFDLQIEAEILGCELLWADDGPPSVKTNPLGETKEIPCLCTIPTKDSGRLPIVLEVMKKMKQQVGESTALYGLVCGPFTLASHLRGNEIFMDMFDDPDYVIQLLNYANKAVKAVAGFYIEAGMDVIAVVDPLVSQISPDHFEEFMTKPFTDFFSFIRGKGTYSSFFVCGDATRNIEVMCQTNPDSISIDENIDMVKAKVITDRYNIAIGGNIPLTTVMLHGTQQDNMKFIVDLLDKVSEGNLIIAPGCDMPYDVPIENTIAVTQAIHETEQVREILKNYVATTEQIDVKLPDYESLTKPLVEVFTLDSATCAACTYMMQAANVIKAEFGDSIDVIEYKYTIKENIARCIKMGVTNLPSIYINGQLKFSSIIPSKLEFSNKIKELI